MTKFITVAGGCFWGTEKFLSYINGVLSTETGYCNGNSPSTSYQEVCNGSGHVEAVRVEYDPTRITLAFLLKIFYQSIDPTLLNRQGNDKGIQYRTGVYYENLDEVTIIEASLKELQDSYNQPIMVECLPLKDYVSAEEYHQKYLDKNPTGYCHLGVHDFDIARNAKDPSIK
ncbi:MAG: peptide-methionine (S)-S-oxide reductase MsrA [Brevinema sp.]